MKRKYALYINGVCYEYFKTIKEIDDYLFEKNIDADKYHIEVKKLRERR
jgi:hypothetical protein